MSPVEGRLSVSRSGQRSPSGTHDAGVALLARPARAILQAFSPDRVFTPGRRCRAVILGMSRDLRVLRLVSERAARCWKVPGMNAIRE